MFEFYNSCCCNLNLNPDSSIACSVALNPDVPISQKPRFYGVNAGRNVSICCLYSKELQTAKAEWYRVDKYDTVVNEITNRIEAVKKYTFRHNHGDRNVFLDIHDVRMENSGVYFCKINNEWGPGTAVQVASKYLGQYVLCRMQTHDAMMQSSLSQDLVVLTRQGEARWRMLSSSSRACCWLCVSLLYCYANTNRWETRCTYCNIKQYICFTNWHCCMCYNGKQLLMCITKSRK